MFCKEIKIFSQNVWKNFLLINTILEVKTVRYSLHWGRSLQNGLGDMCVKFTNSGLSFSLLHFSFLFSFYFIFLNFLFLEHRVRVRSQDTENKVEGSRTNDIIQHGYYMLTLCSTYGHLG